MRAIVCLFCACLYSCCFAQIGSKPVANPLPPALPEALDRPFRGIVQLHVDATDTAHSIFRVTESVPLQAAGEIVLLYPEWETTSHAPTSSAVELAGLQMQIDGEAVQWRRDVANVHAFHVKASHPGQRLNLSFQYVPPKTEAALRPQMINVQWQRLLLYPAGWYTRDIHIAVSLQLPPGLRPFTALDSKQKPTAASGLYTFAPDTLDRLVDTPVYAAKFARILDLSSSNTPVRLNLMADAPGDLDVSPVQLAGLKTLIVQTEKVFGPAPFHHYDVLVSLSDELSPGGGLEHLDEGENNLPSHYFTDAEQQLNNVDLIAHEYVHSWNGRFRQPDGLWSPTFNRPMDPSLLWIYEGQTEFWGRVLAARAGQRTTQQTLEKLALDAATVSNRSGRAWKTLADSTLDVLYMPQHTISWRDWQRREDYYPEGVLLWLDVEAHMRELSGERYGLDDFSHVFFSTHGRKEGISTYNFLEVCNTLNALVPTDWKGFLIRHLQTHDTAVALAGLARSGWELTYTSTSTETFQQDEAEAGATNLDASLGMQVRSNGNVRSVVWDGPAFRAGLSPGTKISLVNGQPFSSTVLLAATQASPSVPVHLQFRDSSNSSDIILSYNGGARYPRLVRLPGTTDRLTPLIVSR